MTRAIVRVSCVGLMVGMLASAITVWAQTPADASRRVSERLRALQRESDDLATREKSLLVELRQLELQRQIKSEELASAEAELAAVEQKIADAETRVASMARAATTAQPDIEARLVRLYKMGRGGYWRALVDSADIRAVGRAYRTAAAMSTLDHDRVRRHEAVLVALKKERADLQGRQESARRLRENAAAARTAIDRAVADRTALVHSIDERRDLAAQMTGELRSAQERLERTIGESSGGAPEVRVPLRPFKGDLPWPTDGIVLRRFGRTSTGARGITVINNGIDLSVPEGRAVSAVHDGVVTFAAPLSGFGNVVIVDHGDRSQSLYGYLGTLDVSKGSRVASGAPLGTTGRNLAGNPALYFELRIDGKPVDPLQWLRPQR